MKQHRVKLKITLWLTLLLLVLAGVLLGFMLSVSQTVVSRSARAQLSSTVTANAALVSLMEDGRVQTQPGFSYNSHGVSTLIYSKNQALLAGQLPQSFESQVPFEAGSLRQVEGTEYLLLDLWVPSGWEEGLWVRGLLELPEAGQTTKNLLIVALIALPSFFFLAVLGCWLTLRRAFRPLDQIQETAAAIGEAKDLSRRIGLGPGKDEFTRLAESFDQLFSRLERSFEAETQFAADASHELRTPVSIIRGACEYGLKYDESPEERRETLEMIHRQTEKMSALISALLTMTRLEQGTEQPKLSRVNLGQLAAAAARELPKDLRPAFEELDPEVFVLADPALLTRAIRNLLENARAYGKPEGHVWLSVGVRAGSAFVRVRDDGIGIAPEQQERIFQRFYQVAPERSQASGSTGLGLAMVQQILRLHGGEVLLESQLGVGSTFTLCLKAL